MDIDRKIRRCVTEVQDRKLLAKLTAGDMVAIEVHYHLNCLVALYNQARQIESSTNEESGDTSLEGIAFVEILSFIDGFLEAQCPSPKIS